MTSVRERPAYHLAMSLLRHVTSPITALMFACVMSPQPVFGQDALAEIKRELAALRAEVQELRSQLDSVKKGEAGNAPQASLQLLETQVRELAQTKVESTSRFPVKVFGTVHANFFSNSANPNWLDIPNLVTPPPAGGQTGSTSASCEQ